MTGSTLMHCPGCGHERNCELRSGVMPGGFICDECFKRRPRISSSAPPEVPRASSSHSFVSEKSSPHLTLSQAKPPEDSSRYGDDLLNDVAKGNLEPLPFKLANVPDDLTGLARRVVEDIELLAGARLALLDTRAMPYACDWAAKRLGCGSSSVNRVTLGLIACGALRDAGVVEVKGRSRPMKLYEPVRAEVSTIAGAERRLQVVA